MKNKKQMGLLVVGEFTTLEGLTYTNYYIRISSFFVNVNNSTTSSISVVCDCYVSRNLFKNNFSTIANSQKVYNFSVNTGDLDTLQMRPFLYPKILELVSNDGSSVQNVIENA